MATSTFVKLAVNVPVKVVAKYVDIVPGKFGAQVRIKGTFDGEDGVLYAPGKAWAAIKALRNAGIIANQQYDEDPAEGASVNCPIETPAFTLVNAQAPGEKYPNLTATTGTPFAANGSVKQPVSYGKTGVPELDEQSEYEDKAVRAIQGAANVTAKLDANAEMYEACLGLAEGIAKDHKITDQQAIVAMAATLFIQSRK